MQNKIKRFSYNQLLVAKVFLQNTGKVVTLSHLEKETKLKGKSLGGVISSLTRTKFRQTPFIEPVGQDIDRAGLRWILNHQSLNTKEALKEIKKLISLYA